MGTKKVSVRLRGGLGNQLFQYAAGYALSMRLGHRLEIDARQLPVQHEAIGGVSHWREQISEFDHAATSIRRNSSEHARPSRLLQLERALGDAAPGALARIGILAGEKSNQHQRLTSLPANRSIRINSYCDSPLFFEGYGDELRRQISTPAKPSAAFLRNLERTRRAGALAIHIRLGDYRNLKHIYGGVDLKYFASGIDLAGVNSSEKPIWIYSDEPELAHSLMTSINPKAVIAPYDGQLSGLENLLLMAECSGLIASNSTFSWWSAYLMAKRSETIVFPRPFFATLERAEPRDLMLRDWIQIGKETTDV